MAAPILGAVVGLLVIGRLPAERQPRSCMRLALLTPLPAPASPSSSRRCRWSGPRGSSPARCRAHAARCRRPSPCRPTAMRGRVFGLAGALSVGVTGACFLAPGGSPSTPRRRLGRHLRGRDAGCSSCSRPLAQASGDRVEATFAAAGGRQPSTRSCEARRRVVGRRTGRRSARGRHPAARPHRTRAARPPRLRPMILARSTCAVGALSLPRAAAACCPAPSSTSRPRWMPCAPSCDDVRHRGCRGRSRPRPSVSTASRPPTPAGARRRHRGRARRPRPGRARRPRGVHPPRPPRARRPAPHRHHDDRRRRRHGHRALGAGRPGRPLRPRRPRRLPQQRRHERRPGPARRRGSPRRRQPAAARQHGGFAGYPHPTILAACALLGVDEVWAMGGAQAVAAFAYGFDQTATDVAASRSAWSPARATSTSPPRSGCSRASSASTPRPAPPRSRCSPTTRADPEHVAADLVIQAEHDPLAAAVLVTDSAELADAVEAALVRRVAATKHAERVARGAGRSQSAVVLVDDLDAGLDVVNAYAAEHLEIQTARRRGRRGPGAQRRRGLRRRWSPVSLGDYCAGSNHVLPTGGCACHSSGLSVQSFLRGIHVVDYCRGRPARGRRARGHPGPRRGPAGPRRGRPSPASPTWT